jgi:hypothetical protein
LAGSTGATTADVLAYSFDGVTYHLFTGAPIACQEGTSIFVRMNAHVKETATSERTDIGVWIATDGGNARTGTCNHYNLVNGVAGVSNIDGDQCGDMSNAAEVIVPLGDIETICQASATSSLLHIGSCLGCAQNIVPSPVFNP